MNAVARARAEGATRTCAGCREAFPQDALVRLAIVPEAPWVVPDAKGRLGGRGVWVQPRRDCIERAARKGGFARALKRKVTVDPDALADLLTVQLQERMRSLVLGAQRGRRLVVGHDAVAESVHRGRARLLWVAEDAGRRDDLEERAARLDQACLVWGTREFIGDLLGREQVAVVAVEDEGIARALAHVAEHLGGLRAGSPSPHKEARGESPATPEDRKPA